MLLTQTLLFLLSLSQLTDILHAYPPRRPKGKSRLRGQSPEAGQLGITPSSLIDILPKGTLLARISQMAKDMDQSPVTARPSRSMANLFMTYGTYIPYFLRLHADPIEIHDENLRPEDRLSDLIGCLQAMQEHLEPNLKIKHTPIPSDILEVCGKDWGQKNGQSNAKNWKAKLLHLRKNIRSYEPARFTLASPQDQAPHLLIPQDMHSFCSYPANLPKIIHRFEWVVIISTLLVTRIYGSRRGSFTIKNNVLGWYYPNDSAPIEDDELLVHLNCLRVALRTAREVYKVPSDAGGRMSVLDAAIAIVEIVPKHTHGLDLFPHDFFERKSGLQPILILPASFKFQDRTEEEMHSYRITFKGQDYGAFYFLTNILGKMMRQAFPDAEEAATFPPIKDLLSCPFNQERIGTHIKFQRSRRSTYTRKAYLHENAFP